VLFVSELAKRASAEASALDETLLRIEGHSGSMVLHPEQHLQIAETYEKAAADYMVPPQHRKAFARKAELFRMLARLGAKRAPVKVAPALPSTAGITSTPMASFAHLFAWQRRR
jgi:hypothetical protein